MSLSKSMIGGGLSDYPKTDRNYHAGAAESNKVRTVQEFLQNNDKQKSGLVPIANFQKVLRIFGLQANINSFKTNEVGMVDYEKALQTLLV